jgi:hypothetical protein
MTILIALALGFTAFLLVILPLSKAVKYPMAQVLITACLCLLSWGMYVLANEQDAQWKASERWQPTEVTILNATDETKTKRKDGKTRITHSFKVRYAYTVDGHSYESTRYTLGTYDSSQTSVENLVSYYRDKSLTHTALYDPQDPAQSTLVRGAQSPKGLLLLLSILPGIAGLFLLYRLVCNAYAMISGQGLAVTKSQ